jgi:hypothetical protein
VSPNHTQLVDPSRPTGLKERVAAFCVDKRKT